MKSPAARKRLLDAIRMGASIDHACRYAGIARSTFYAWKDRAEADNATDEDRAWLADLEAAEGSFVIANLATIERAAKAGNWQASAWKLERRYPNEYGRRDRHQVEGVHVVTSPDLVEAFKSGVTAASDDAIERIAAALTKE